MASFNTFEEMEPWQKSRELTKQIYRITAEGTFARDFGLKVSGLMGYLGRSESEEPSLRDYLLNLKT